ncbi:MAG: preprotein translocase subunit SecE [Chloroflexi bacterium]|jgi:preprotein translocase subunit SecE|nr:preprotein translocase subunit SecE [Chloroflexota bacterium]
MAEPTKTKKGLRTENKPVKKKPNKLVKWWNETIGELRKVSWPTKEEALRMTKIVLVVVVAMAVFLGVVDFIFSELIGLIVG